ncbi:lytic transglycosylase domain-containing protein [uncultured Enterovirga sp.]|uniref:lytic transglycosylase domain-containing protein n=1 Tax=uncultured Enterovirga sp. TaxID=2026352 RepID=UPI0035C97261
MRAVSYVSMVVAAGLIGGATAGEKLPNRVLAAAIDRDGTVRIEGRPGDAASPQFIGAAIPAVGSFAPAPTAAGTCSFEKVPSPAEAETLARKVATEETMDPGLVVAVARAESRFRMDQVSPKGAIGLMQLMPATAKRFGVDACDPADNVRGGVRFLRALLERYRNPMHVLAAYNAGEDAVEQHRGVPPFPETVRYVAAVLNDLNGWPKPAAGTASRPRRAGAAPDSTNPEASWSQGFVMHVEN